MGMQLATYHERLPTTTGYNTISLDSATKASICLDSNEIVNNYILNNAILQRGVEEAETAPKWNKTHRASKARAWRVA